MLDSVMFEQSRWMYWKDVFLKKWNKQASDDQQLKHIRVHDLRDAHGMFLAVNGADLKTIQKKLRYAKATTMNYYLDKLLGVEDNILKPTKRVCCYPVCYLKKSWLFVDFDVMQFIEIFG